MNHNSQILVITPHPDDAEFGTAGTVARWIAEGKSVIYAVCTNGEKGTDDINMDPKVLATIRKQEQLAAARILGVEEVIFLDYPDQGLEDTSEFRKDIVRLIRTYRPETVITVDPYRRYIWHRDHRITGQVVLDAVFPYARDYLSYPDLLKENLQPHKVREVLLWGSEENNFCVNITSYFDLKFRALSCHQSQVGGSRLPGVKKWLKERAIMMAEGEDFELAEAFHRVEIWP
ncbi:MAG: PIG-L family deacetylase [Atribacterota bacterium]|nr:PIG-L family deacetylase [Atribacterota bacterium]